MFLDTGNIEEIREGLKTGILKGVTTNPTILKKEGVKRFEQIGKILELNPEILFVQIIGDTLDDLFDDYLKIKEFGNSKNIEIGIKVPMDYKGLELVKRIKEDNKKVIVLGTGIYSSDQGILSALAGCDYLAPYVNRMLNNSIDPFKEIEKIRIFIDDRNLNTEILAASFKNTSQIVNALIAGSHTCTISFDLLKQMMDKPLAVEAIKVFNEDGKELG